jgi:hypothetical protein
LFLFFYQSSSGVSGASDSLRLTLHAASGPGGQVTGLGATLSEINGVTYGTPERNFWKRFDLTTPVFFATGECGAFVLKNTGANPSTYFPTFKVAGNRTEKFSGSGYFDVPFTMYSINGSQNTTQYKRMYPFAIKTSSRIYGDIRLESNVSNSIHLGYPSGTQERGLLLNNGPYKQFIYGMAWDSGGSTGNFSSIKIREFSLYDNETVQGATIYQYEFNRPQPGASAEQIMGFHFFEKLICLEPNKVYRITMVPTASTSRPRNTLSTVHGITYMPVFSVEEQHKLMGSTGLYGWCTWWSGTSWINKNPQAGATAISQPDIILFKFGDPRTSTFVGGIQT